MILAKTPEGGDMHNKFLVIASLIFIQFNLVARDCTEERNQLADKLENHLIDELGGYVEDKTKLDGLVTPFLHFVKNHHRANNDAERWDAGIDLYFDSTYGRILPEAVYGGFKQRAKDFFRAFEGMGETNGGCGDRPGRDTLLGNGGADRRIDPLVLDLDADGLETIALDQSQAFFDLTGDRFATRTAWISKDDGFLAMDRNGDGVINDISELFGSANVSGFTELSLLDKNKDNFITYEGDPEFSKILLWQDDNEDGKTDPGELSSLFSANIRSIDLNAQTVEVQENDVQIVSQSIFTFSNDDEGDIFDVDFLTRPLYSRYVGVSSDGALSPEHAAATENEDYSFPNIRGYGRFPNLHTASSQNSTLRSTLENAIQLQNIETLLSSLDEILFLWAGVQEVTLESLDPESRLSVEEGSVKFGRADVKLPLKQLGVLKQYSALDLLKVRDGQWIDSGQTQFTGALYQDAWADLRKNLLAKLLAGSELLNGNGFELSYDSTTDYLKMNHSPLPKEALTALFQTWLNSQDEQENKALAQWFVISEISAPAKRHFSALLTQTLSEDSNAFPVSKLGNPLLPFVVEIEMGTDGPDTFEGSPQDNLVVSYEGDDTVRGQSGNDTLLGGIGNDTLIGGAEDDRLLGQQGEDRLIGGSGDDWIEGGAGNDYLAGGKGSDTYFFEPGFGSDILDFASRRRQLQLNTLQFGGNLTASTLSAERVQKDLLLRFESGDEIKIIGLFDLAKSAGNIVLKFSDGSQQTLYQLLDLDMDEAYDQLYDSIISGNWDSFSSLVAMGLDPNFRHPDSGNTLLHTAAKYGRIDMMRILVARGGNINLQNDKGESVLFRAVEGRETEMVRWLTSRADLAINLRTHQGRTAIRKAAELGHADIMALLLRVPGRDINLGYYEGSNPLSAAANNGHLEVLKLLIACEDLDPYLRDWSGDDALHEAIEGREPEAALLLLESFEPQWINGRNIKGNTPLHRAAYRGLSEVVRKLLTYPNIELNAQNLYLATPLYMAASEGHTEIATLLIDQPGVDFNLPQRERFSPLMKAAKEGHTEIVQKLLEKNTLLINAQQNDGWTALHYAAYNNREGAFKALLDHSQILADAKNDVEATPLMLAAGQGYVELVQALVQRADVNINSEGGYSMRSPLLWAVYENRLNVVQALVELEGVLVNLTDENGDSALHLSKSPAITRALLEHGAINPNLADHSNVTPIIKAVSVGKIGIFRALIDHPDTRLDQLDSSGRTALHRLAYETETDERLQMADLFIEKGTDWLNLQEEYGQTALSRAIDLRRFQLAAKLLEQPSIDVRLADYTGKTPLHFASNEGASGIMQKLLEHAEVQVNRRDHSGRTPLHLAATQNKVETLSKLLADDRTEVNLPDEYGNTPLHQAARLNYLQIVQKLLQSGKADKNRFNAQGKKAIDLTTNDEIRALLATE